jgi:hypothetical protein
VAEAGRGVKGALGGKCEVRAARSTQDQKTQARQKEES